MAKQPDTDILVCLDFVLKRMELGIANSWPAGQRSVRDGIAEIRRLRRENGRLRSELKELRPMGYLGD